MEPTAAGVLAKTPLAHLVVYCLDKKLRGALILRPEGEDDAARADVITFLEGMPAKIKVSDPVEHLGRVLVELGAIDHGVYNESLLALGRGEGLHGQILVRSGKLDAPGLEKGLRAQIARKLGHLFGRPPTTRFAYYENTDFLGRYGGPDLFPVDPAPIVWAGIRANPSAAHVDAAFDKVISTPLRIRPGTETSRFEFTRAEQEVLTLLRSQPMTASDLANAGVADAKTVRCLVYGLLLLKRIETVSAAGRSIAPTSGAPSGMVMPSTAPRTASPNQSVAPRTGPVTTIAPVSAEPISANPTSAGVVSKVALSKTATAAGSTVDARRSTAGASEPAKDAARRTEIRSKAAAIAKENYFEMLGIPQESSADDARNAYFQLAKRWHPDRLPVDLADLKDDVARVFANIAEAYQTLTDADRRLRYVQLLKQGGGTPEDQAEVQRVVEASNSFQKAEFFVNKGALSDAEPHANRAIELDPGDADHVALWCWIQANRSERRDAGRYEDLLAKLDKAIADAPRSERARFYRAMILKSAGRMGEAIRDFRDVADANPRHVEAVREVRLYSMRQDRDRKAKDDGNSSLLGRFMKKK